MRDLALEHFLLLLREGAPLRGEVVQEPKMPILFGHRTIPEADEAFLAFGSTWLAVDATQPDHRAEPFPESEPVVRSLRVGSMQHVGAKEGQVLGLRGRELAEAPREDHAHPASVSST